MRKFLYPSSQSRVNGLCMVFLLNFLFFGSTIAKIPGNISGSNPDAFIDITGRVVSASDDSGIPGVSVLIKGTFSGTVTDVEGFYSISVPNEDDILVFSSIGY